MISPSRPAPVTVQSPVPLRKPKQPTLLQELRQYAAEPLASEQAAVISDGKARLWWCAAGAALALAGMTIHRHPKLWVPIGYTGASVAVSLSMGAAMEGTKSRAHRSVSAAITSARPLGTVANAWAKTEQRQLKGFDQLVSQYLFDEWVTDHHPTVTVTAAAVPTAAAVAKDLGTHPKSALVGGVPGAGKGVFYLSALAELKECHPDTRVMLINPKQSGLEAGTAKAPALVMSRDFSGGQPDELALWLWDCVEQFKRWEGPKLLIIDEMASVMATLKLASRSLQILPKFRAFLSHITSMGDSEQHWLWLVSQDCSADGLGISSALRATLRAVAIVAPHNRQSLKAFLSAQWVPMPDGGTAELDQLMKTSEVGRAIFDGKQGRWLPMQRLENLTGWDRDAGKPVSGAITAPHFWDSDMNLDYFEVWQEFLENRPDGRCTVREAMQRAPRQIRTTAEGTREAFTQLDRMNFGKFDPDNDVFTVATVATDDELP